MKETKIMPLYKYSHGSARGAMSWSFLFSRITRLWICIISNTINLRLSAFICGSFFAEAPDINCLKSIKADVSQHNIYQNHQISLSCIDSSNEPMLLRVKTFINNRTRMTQIRRIFTDFSTIEENILNTFTQLGGMLNIPLSIKEFKAYEKALKI